MTTQGSVSRLEEEFPKGWLPRSTALVDGANAPKCVITGHLSLCQACPATDLAEWVYRLAELILINQAIGVIST